MSAVRINEVGPRDGLQNEKATIPTEVKVAFIDALSDTGVAEIEVTSFVAANRIPQLADASDVFARIRRKPGVVYSALVPNEKGLERALEAHPDRISVFTATSETFSQRNVNTSIDGTIHRFEPVIEAARARDLPVRGYISTAFHCPFEGPMAPGLTLELAARLFDLGCDIVAVSDTIGKATTEEIARLLDLAIGRFGAERIAVHLHDTYGRAVDNSVTAWRMGIRTIDASAGGIGGCPYAPGAPGNVPTEPLARTLETAGADLHLDYDAIARAREIIAPHLGRPLGPRNYAKPLV